MSTLAFYKYQGTGNDFILVDDRQDHFPKKDTKLIAQLCDRKFGIGADGLICLQNNVQHDFTMLYYNADGRESSMCGNGGRCIVSFAQFLGLIKESAVFEAVDGLHHARLFDNSQVSLQMKDVNQVSSIGNYFFTNTGSPHHVQLTDNLEHTDVVSLGRSLRHDIYGDEGANINFVQPVTATSFKVRTYERGVEDETLSCGTGVTAVALAMHASQQTAAREIELQTPGGNLKVQFESNPTGGYHNIWLTGPATQVYTGNIDI